MWSAIVAFFKIFGPLLVKVTELLVGLINSWQSYIEAKKKRLADQVKDELETKMKAKERQYLKEVANVKAFDRMIDESWKTRKDQIKTRIDNKDYSSVLTDFIQEVDKDSVNEVLFNEDMSSEYRAIKITQIMKGRGDNV